MTDAEVASSVSDVYQRSKSSKVQPSCQRRVLGSTLEPESNNLFSTRRPLMPWRSTEELKACQLYQYVGNT